MNRIRLHVAARLASVGLAAGTFAVVAPAPLLAQGPPAAPAQEPDEDHAAANPPPAPPAQFVPDPSPPAFVPDPPPARFEPDPRPDDDRSDRPGPDRGGNDRDHDDRRAQPGESDGPSSDVLNAVPSAGRTDVPSFLIDRFEVPPFLLPIYQAAGIEYGVRWEILAAINEIETDYGRNLNVSSAGALGWMQFMPGTWRAYGVDANRDGRKDPYNPVDAIFAAARYLKAAGAEEDLSAALFAYNHASWYVADVLRRARLLAALPDELVSALSSLAQGRPPVLGRARTVRARGHAGRARALVIETGREARAVAVTDGQVVRIGRSARLGRFVKLRDPYGNTHTYGGLGSVERRYPTLPAGRAGAPVATRGDDIAVPPRASDTPPAKVQDPAARAPVAPGAPGGATFDLRGGAAIGPAVAAAPSDAQPLARDGSSARRARAARSAGVRPAGRSVAETMAPTAPAAGKPRVLRWPLGATLGSLRHIAAAWRTTETAPPAPRSATPRTGADATRGATAYDDRLVGGLKRLRYRVLREGSRVVAGTVLARSGRSSNTGPAHRVQFEIRPAGRRSPRIDPHPIVAGWKLLAAAQRPSGREPSIGQVLLLGDRALARLVLADRRVDIYRCGRQDIRAGRIDRRVLVTLELLAMTGLSPTVSSLRCGHGRLTSSGHVSEHTSGNAVDIAAINGTAVSGHQGAGSITERAIQRLLTLQGTVQPHQIISLMTFDGADNTLAMADHDDHIHVGFRPEQMPGSLGARSLDGVLGPREWQRLVARLNTIDNPRVRTIPSRYAATTRHTRP